MQTAGVAQGEDPVGAVRKAFCTTSTKRMEATVEAKGHGLASAMDKTESMMGMAVAASAVPPPTTGTKMRNALAFPTCPS
jgi:hypothetical protein